MKILFEIGILFFLFGNYTTYGQETKMKYIGLNHQLINDTSNLMLSLSNKVYFAGEMHDKAVNYDLHINLLKILLKDEKNKYIIVMEMALNNEKYFNDYLKTGNESLVKILGYNSENDLNYCRNLRQLWIRQPDSLKFEIRCIDVPINKRSALSNIGDLMDDNYPKNIASFNQLVRIGNKKMYTNKKALMVLRDLETESNRYNPIFRQYLGKNYDEFIHQLRAGIIALDSTNILNSAGLEKREQFMYENLKKIIKENPDAKIFGQFGRAHVPITYQKSWIHLKDWKSLAARLNTNDDSPVKGKVCSIVYYYTSTMEDENKRYIEPIIKKEDIPLFLKYSTTPLTLFKLDGENTPFKDMAERFQYIILINIKPR